MHLVYDRQWFDKKAKAGCCPFARELYHKKYSNIDHRCCTGRLDEIEPWRPVGGGTWKSIKEHPSVLSQSSNATILIQGDSLAAQHFLAMLCHAWSTKGMKVVNLVNHAPKGHKARWEAQIEPIGITISFAKNDFPEHVKSWPYEYKKFGRSYQTAQRS